MSQQSFILGALIGGASASILLLYLRRKNNIPPKTIIGEIHEPPQEAVVNEVLFFPDKEFPCNYMIRQLSVFPVEDRTSCHNISCKKLHGRSHEPPSSLLKFLKYLSEARSSVDLCIYVFTQQALSNILRKLTTADVKIRLITDGAEDEAMSSQVEKLREDGIVVKSNKQNTGALMHHKFVIIDGKLLLTGSFNWTNKAVVSNYEAVIVTSEKSFVEPFKGEFEKMWSMFPAHPKSRKHFN